MSRASHVVAIGNDTEQGAAQRLRIKQSMAELLATWFGGAPAAAPAPAAAAPSPASEVVKSEAITVSEVQLDVSDHKPVVDADETVMNEASPKVDDVAVTNEASQSRPGTRPALGEATSTTLNLTAMRSVSESNSDSPTSTMRSLMELKTTNAALFRGPAVPFHYIGKDGLQHAGEDVDGCGLQMSGSTVVALHRNGMAARWGELKKGDSAFLRFLLHGVNPTPEPCSARALPSC